MKIHGLPIIFARDMYEAADLTTNRDNAPRRAMTAEDCAEAAEECLALMAPKLAAWVEARR